MELSAREVDVLRGMADGRTNAQIAREHFVSEDTVKTHARRMFRKLGVSCRSEAVAVGHRLGILGESPEPVDAAARRVRQVHTEWAEMRRRTPGSLLAAYYDRIGAALDGD